MMSLNWGNLTTEEKAEYMRLQMSPAYGGHSAYYPDDVGECGACGYPILGNGWCGKCSSRWQELRNKLEAKTNG